MHTLQTYLHKLHLNIVLNLRLGISSGLFPSGFPTNILCTFVISPMHVTFPSHFLHSRNPKIWQLNLILAGITVE